MAKSRTKPEPSSGPRAIVRVLRLFETLSSHPEGLSLGDLAMRLEEPKSTLLNSLRALEMDGFLNLDGTLYQLGPKTFRLATQIGNSWSLMRVMRSHLRELSERTQETALLSVLDREQQRFVHVDGIESDQRVRYVLSIGSGGPLYATASGRVLLAFQSQDYQDAYIESVTMSPLTAATNVDKDVLRAQLEEIRQRRVWISMGEINAEGGAIAAPVFGANGEIAASLSIALPLTRLDPHKKELTFIVADVAAHASGAELPLIPDLFEQS